ncbi:exodeoxyribonuclease VII large subunit [Paracoccus pacificus]|uniref:Exodeoxyribonuclease 7 large subunit n=1 Tax=Paracoccus pacificus TaxID=1463598 RepID=A0ABW4RB96_9RHOB
MDDLIDEPAAGGNAHEYTVSEISGAVKRTLEDQFGRIRVRGEIGRVSRPASGHLYFDMKDDRALIASVCWKGQVARLVQMPEEGMEVIATGRITTFAGQSKYQLIVDQIEPAGAGALMAMLDKRRRMLEAEGLFAAGRKKPLPFLPDVIGVITSPSGAVIRDILHRLRDRFPSRVVIWPVAVQGAKCAPEVTAAIRGFNALPATGGPVPRPDLLIVARGGGSLEDLWGFNEEIVVRAAADSAIPLISAVGHETDTTLIDYAADLRAPTPTAAAELAVPVRLDLAQRLDELAARMLRGMRIRVDQPRQRLRDLARAMGRPQTLTEPARQRLDLWAERLEPALRSFVARRRDILNSRPVRPALLTGYLSNRRQAVRALAARLRPATDRRIERRQDQFQSLATRLHPAFRRNLDDLTRHARRDAERLAGLTARLSAAGARITPPRQQTLDRLDRLRRTLGYPETLKRGFAVVHGPKGLITSAEVAAKTPRMEIEFADGRTAVTPVTPEPKPASAPRKPPPGQGSLF